MYQNNKQTFHGRFCCRSSFGERRLDDAIHGSKPGEWIPLNHLGSRRKKWQVSCEDDLSFDEVAGFDHLLLHV